MNCAWPRLHRVILLCGLLFLLLSPLTARAIGSCPPVGQSPSCAVLITINPNGSLSVQIDPGIGPYDGVEDTLVGVINNSGATVFGISITGNGIFGFDGDGANGGNYAGPGVSFSPLDANAGTVNFLQGLNDKGFLWFSLEGAPSQVKLAKTVTLDPGHGTGCTGKYPRGAIGVTSYPDIPKPGFLQEDLLNFSIASTTQGLLQASGYKVAMTKNSTAACPTYGERANVAKQNNSNIFVSVHVNQPISFLLRPICGTGTSALYNGTKTDSKTLAKFMVGSVSSSLGVGVLLTTSLCLGTDNINVNNDGTYERNNLQVLKLSLPTAVLIETARLSPPDEDIMHTSSGAAANGIKSAIDSFVNQ